MPNHLAGETSPYLLQHADNPVEWYAWGEVALKKAAEENKPILLSIGYSACHWCHVMAHESFEDIETAHEMNKLFINIKVDREERPDLDKIYQAAHSMLTQRPGGWPLTVFLSPQDHLPIFAGTYFPSEPRYGMPSFRQLMQHISEVCENRRDDIDKQSASVRDAYRQIAKQESQKVSMLDSMPLDVARNQIEKQFDSKQGGYSSAPKFPHTPILERALRHWAKTRMQGNADQRLLHTALYTLEKMANGGLFDHLGGGFCRYSTDELWMIPHFEKMLYDNGTLLLLYANAYCIANNAMFAATAHKTANWVMREMQSADGGYYSALDADSEGVEGKFYAWSRDEVNEIIKEDDSAVFMRCFGLDEEPNFEGAWHLHRYYNTDELALHFERTANEVDESLESALGSLFQRRVNRVKPGRDDKILCSWNALMIRGMAIAGRLLNESRYTDSALLATDFIHEQMWQNQRLLASHKDGVSHLNAYLDDYAYLLDALLELLQSSWNATWAGWAMEIADVLIEQFEDSTNGGFYFTSHDHEQLIHRGKPYADDAIPSGNGIAAFALNRLGYLCANHKYIDAAERCLKAAMNSIQNSAVAHCTLLHALEEHLQAPVIFIVRAKASLVDPIRQNLGGRYMPGCLVFVIPGEETLSAEFGEKTPHGDFCAYRCEGTVCSEPLLDEAELYKSLDELTVNLS